MEVRLIRRGSKSCKQIHDNTPIKWYVGEKYKTDLIVNYGVTGKKLDNFYNKFPSAKKIQIVNRHIGISKYNMVCAASDKGIIVPESKLSLSKNDKVSDFIEKKFRSIGGIGIRNARGKSKMSGKYYQRNISDRIFELRVHAFRWMKAWKIQKRMGDTNKIAWNFTNGGMFININNPNRYKIFVDAIDISRKILDIARMDFGAVDFIVDKKYNLYFIEINSSPGFTEFSSNIYFEAFKNLCNIKKHVLKEFVR